MTTTCLRFVLVISMSSAEPACHSLFTHFHRPALHCILLLWYVATLRLSVIFYFQLLFAKVYSRICVLEIEASFSVCVLFVIITVLFCLYVCLLPVFIIFLLLVVRLVKLCGVSYNYQKLNITKIQVNTETFLGDYNLFLYPVVPQ